MSYHILHQFDEQWLVELKQDALARHATAGSTNSFTDGNHPVRRSRLATRESQRWIIVALSILMATFALLFAIDSSHRTEALQQRLDALETTAGK
jgi:hypothetical protein